MGRYCADCGDYCDRYDFSLNQWNKGNGLSRCSDCVQGGGYQQPAPVRFQCYQCNRLFNSQNELNMHMQVHRPREVACPVCGERRFKSGANAVQHVESGYCSGCRGRENAREQIYKFAGSQRQMHRYMTDVPLLTNGSSYGNVPAYPYSCPECSKAFRDLSQLLQHQDQKHNNSRMLSYY